MIFAYFLHGESFTRKDGIASVILVIGLVITSLCAPLDFSTYSTKKQLMLFAKPPFITFSIFLFISIIFLLIVNVLLENNIRKDYPSFKKLSLWKLILYIFTFGGLAGIFGGSVILLMKSTIELFVSDIFCGFTCFISDWLMYVLIISLIFFWTVKMFWLNRGLMIFRSVFSNFLFSI